MTEIDVVLVRRRLATITANLWDLATVAGLSLDEYRASRPSRPSRPIS